jgi:hypothetical protein
MRKLIALILLFGSLTANAALASEEKALDLNVKYLYSKPSTNSSLVYSIPIEVKLLDISEDGNWYKVRISYKIAFCSYNYVGWTNIPIAQVLSESDKNPSEIAKAPVIEE